MLRFISAGGVNMGWNTFITPFPSGDDFAKNDRALNRVEGPIMPSNKPNV
jgi:hypothetical protein